MPGCCVPECKNRTEKGFRLFRLPCGEQNKTRRNLWIQLIRRSDLAPTSKICEVHFSEKQFEAKRADKKRLLCGGAVPDLLLPSLESATTDVEQKQVQNLDSSENINKYTHEDLQYTVIYENLECVIGNDENNIPEENLHGCHCKQKFDNVLISNTIIENNKNENIEKKLRQALRNSEKKCSVYKRRYEQQDKRLNKIFNRDQLNFLKTGSHRGIKWSKETLTKGLNLYLACGEKGYKELRKQNLPYPSIRTIQHHFQKLKCGSLKQIKEV